MYEKTKLFRDQESEGYTFHNVGPSLQVDLEAFL